MENKKTFDRIAIFGRRRPQPAYGGLPRHGKFFSTPNTYIIIAILITGAKVMDVWSFDKNQIHYFFGTFKSDKTKGSSYFSKSRKLLPQ